MDITPEQLNQWTQVIWNAGWRVLLVFVIVVYRDLVIHAGKSIIDILASWLKRNA